MSIMHKKMCGFATINTVKDECLYLSKKCLNENLIDISLHNKIKQYVNISAIHNIRKISRLLIVQYCTQEDLRDKILLLVQPKNIKYVEV